MAEYTADAWEKAGREAAEREAVKLTLPSGMVILARKPDPMMLAIGGMLPAGLVEGDGDEGRPKSAAESRKAGAEVIRLIRDLLVYCCVKPRISMNPSGPDEIHPSRLPDADATFILRWARREEDTAGLRSFRGDGGSTGAGVRGGDVVDQAKLDARDRRSGDGASAGSGDCGEAGAAQSGNQPRG